MKKVLLAVFALLFTHLALAQKGIYHNDNLSFGSNFVSGEKAMSQINLDIGMGYSFSEKFRLGLILELGFSFFRDELNYQANQLTSGIGLSGSFRFYTNEKISLRSETHFVMGSPTRERYSDWFFMRCGTEVQLFSSLSILDTHPYIALGTKVIGAVYEKNNITIERTYLQPYLSIGIIRNF
ncbi:hypothetical protein [Capnocytophaga bilenii]